MTDTPIDHISPDSINQELNTLEAEAGPDPVDQARQVAAAGDQDEYKQLLVYVLGPLFEILAPGWQVDEKEIDQLGEAYAGLLNKYFPGGATQFGPEIGASMITLAVFGPRLAARMPRKAPAEAPTVQPENDKEGGDRGSK